MEAPTALRTQRPARRAALLVVALLAGFLAVTAASASPASALCVADPLVGNWHNIDASTRSMTRASISFSCGDVVLCDTNGNCSGGQSSWAVSLWGKCSPTDCAWGSRPATKRSDGWLRTSYNHGFATRDVWLKTYSYYGRTYLRVYVYTDFTAADGRADYTTDEWMLP
jgi:hypothetical protein